MTEYISDVLIVGAGLCGLMAAHKISERNLSIRLVDKGTSVGGRLATRRIGEGIADHGAQFFTIRSNDFQQYVERWLAEKIVYQWSRGFSDGLRSIEQFDGHPRYAAYGGMNALGKHLATGLASKADIKTNVKIATIVQDHDVWRASDESGNTYKAKSIVLTAPVPQSLALIAALRDKLTAADRKALERINYTPCVAGLFRIQGEVNLPEPGALQRPDAVLSWISDNQRKGISPNAKLITVHASGSISQNLWDLAENEALSFIRQEFELFLEKGATILEAQIKRWRYSQPTVLHSERYLMAHGLPPLAFAGDAFGEARVEGAFLSGIAVGDAITSHLSNIHA